MAKDAFGLLSLLLFRFTHKPKIFIAYQSKSNYILLLNHAFTHSKMETSLHKKLKFDSNPLGALMK